MREAAKYRYQGFLHKLGTSNMADDRHRKYNIKHRAKREEKRRELRAWLNEQKCIPCADCKGTFPSMCMDFDHRDRNDKSFGIGRWANGMSRATLAVEIAKCDVVCANCHRIRTHAPPRM